MKIQYFVRTTGPNQDDAVRVMELRKAGHKVIMSNGDFKKGFETGCDAVFLSADFPHVERWAVSKGIEVMKPVVPVDPEAAVAAEPEPVKEVKTDADALSEDTEKQEEKAEEKVKPRRQRRTRQAEDDAV